MTALLLPLLLLPAAAPIEFLEDRFELPAGFRLYRAAGRDLCGGSYDLAFDGEGRLLVGDGNAVRRLADSDGDGVFDRMETIAGGLGPRGPQGLLVLGDRLFAVGGDGVQLFEGYGSGGQPVHRGRAGQRFGTGGDHDAHTVLRGHDGFVYFITGDGGGARERVHITEESSPALFERSCTVFRVSPDGARWECIATGGRNAPNLGMNYLGELFSLDSDMEWHVDCPWWRPVRLHHWTAGGDQGWQEVGAYPPYYLDNLPGILDVGRGSPDWGVFYEHRQFPARYHDAYLVCDYPSKSATTGGYETAGRLFAFFLAREGAGWKASMEVFVRPKPGARDAAGEPLQFALVDAEVAPDGSLLLSDHNQGIWRLLHDPEGRSRGATAAPPMTPAWPALPAEKTRLLEELLAVPQPGSEWARRREEEIRTALGASAGAELEALALEAAAPLPARLRALRLLAPAFASLSPALVERLAAAAAPEVRGQAAWLAGIRSQAGEVPLLERLLDDADAFVRRRAAEALARVHRPETAARLVARLADPVRLVRYVAMTSLAHHPCDAWLEGALARPEPQVQMRALVAAGLRREPPPADAVRHVAGRLIESFREGGSREEVLDLLRVLGRFRESLREGETRELAAGFLLARLGDADRDIRWETARLLGEYRVEMAFGKLLAALEAEPDRVAQFHLAQALSRLPAGWTAGEEDRAVAWLLATQKGWFAEPQGKGLQFPQFWATVLGEFARHHQTALLRQLPAVDFAGPLGGVVVEALARTSGGTGALTALYLANPAPAARRRILGELGESRDERARTFLREEALRLSDPDLRGAAIRALARGAPEAADLPFIEDGLTHADEDTVRASLRALARGPSTASERLASRLLALLLGRDEFFRAAEAALVAASGKQRPGFDPQAANARRRRPGEEEIAAGRLFWRQWFAEKFGHEFTAEPGTAGEKSDEELREFLAGDRVQGGDPERGRRVYEAARCASCHGGSGPADRLFGPDLTGVTRRLSRAELADSLAFPSKQVADRFKGVLVHLRDGTLLAGFITEETPEEVLLADSEKVHRIPRSDLELRAPLETSLMPERLLNRLSWDEIRDLHAFMDTIGAGPRTGAAGEDWPGWRGGRGDGLTPERGLPEKWSAGENVAWSTDLPGWGNSSPAVAGDRVHVTAQSDDDVLHVIALDRGTGKIVWDTPVGQGKLKAHQLHNMATPTPAVDGERVWALFGTGVLVCLDRDGKVVWKRDLTADHGEYKILWGMGSSPVLHGDRLFLICLHGGPSYVLAVDKATGRDLWKAARDLPCRAEAVDSYSTPILLAEDGRVELVVAGAAHVNAYDPATGKQIWISTGLGIDHDWGRTISSPTAGEGIVFACSASTQGLGKLIAVPAGGSGDVSARRLWEYEKFTPDCPTPVAAGGIVYLVRDDGVGSALDARSGKLHWKKRLADVDFKASPVAGDGKVYFLATDGRCVVLKQGPEGEVLAENQLEGNFIASPAVSRGQIFLRARSRVYAVGPPAKAPGG